MKYLAILPALFFGWSALAVGVGGVDGGGGDVLSHYMVCNLATGQGTGAVNYEYDFFFESLQPSPEQSAEVLLRVGMGDSLLRDMCWQQSTTFPATQNGHQVALSGTLACVQNYTLQVTLTVDTNAMTLTQSPSGPGVYSCRWTQVPQCYSRAASREKYRSKDVVVPASMLTEALE
jgi:hypothetical protein